MLKYFKIIIAGSLISVITLILIIIGKYTGEGNQSDTALKTILVSLTVYAIAVPVMLRMLRLTKIKQLSIGFGLLVLLFAELFLWYVLFYGFNKFPAPEYIIYFFIPFALYILFSVCCFILFFLINPKQNNEQ